MTFRLFAGGLAAYLYNEVLTFVPSRTLRHAYLRMWLGGMGRGTGVQMRNRFIDGPKVFLGERNVINVGCMLRARHYRITTGNDVSIGPEAALLTLGHDPQSPDFSDKGGDITIGDHVWIGYRAIILPGITIGEGAVVGAGSVVTKDVEPFTIVAGNPARKVGERSRDIRYQLDFRPWLM